MGTGREERGAAQGGVVEDRIGRAPLAGGMGPVLVLMVVGQAVEQPPQLGEQQGQGQQQGTQGRAGHDHWIIANRIRRCQGPNRLSDA